MDVRFLKSLARFVADNCTARFAEYDEDLKTVIREIGLRHLLINRRLHVLLEKLKTIDVPVIILKGNHLIRDLYPFGVRPIEDIDILVDRKYRLAVDKILRDMGYSDSAYDLDAWTHFNVANRMTYLNHATPVIPIDVHCSLGPYPYLGRIPFGELLYNTKELSENGLDFFVLRDEMLFIHLCLHIFQHHDEHWGVSAYDLSALTSLRKQTIDWNRIVGLIEKHKLSLPVQYALKRRQKRQ